MVRDPSKSPSTLQMGSGLWAEEHLPHITQSWDANTCDSLRCQLLTLHGPLGMGQHRQGYDQGVRGSE